MKPKVLFVDDDTLMLAAARRLFRDRFAVTTASSGPDALRQIKADGAFAVIVADLQMPGMNGLDFLNEAQVLSPASVRIILTANADQKMAVQAVNEGHVFRFLNKPCEMAKLQRSIEAGLQQYLLITAEQELLEKTLSGTLKLLTEILANLEPECFGRSQRIRDYAKRFGQTSHTSQTWALEAAAMLARIGILTMPGTILDKLHARKDLTGPEQELLASLPRLGYNLLLNIPRLAPVAEIVLYQQKNFDGSGFPPEEAGGGSIPIGARIFRVLADLVQLEDEGIATPKALELLRARKGCYDPRVLQAAFATFDVYLPPASPLEPTSHALRLTDLRAGHVLLSNVQTTDGLLIVSSGTELTQMLLQRLRNFAVLSGIREPIYVCAS